MLPLALKKVLVAVRLDETGANAAVAASALAVAAGAKLHAAFVASPTAERDSGQRSIEPKNALLTMLERAGVKIAAQSAHVLTGDPARAIGLLADSLSADAIVLGRHAPAPSTARALGGTALAVVTNASSPCLVISSTLAIPLQRVLVPLDLSDTARGALLVGMWWASALRPPALGSSPAVEVALTALHVSASPHPTGLIGGSKTLERELENIRREAGTWASVAISLETTVNPDAAHGIVDYIAAHAPGLVVMGTRGLNLEPTGRLGSVTAQVSQSVDVPMLLVPPAVWMAHAPGRQHV
jgi:nucleotide-binding universal stress UspA family protein